MKRALLIFVLLFAWAPGVALADYDARKSEAMSELEKAQLSDEERAVLKPTLERYFSAREDCLEALVAIVEKADRGEQDANFTARAFICGTSGAQIVNDGFDDIKDPSIGALGFVNVFAAHESAFFQSLAAVTAAEGRDRIITVGWQVAEMADILEEKWETILDEDETLDERAKALTGEIRKDFDVVLKQAADAHPDLREVLLAGVKKWSVAETAPDITTPSKILDAILAALKAVAGPLIETWEATNTRSESRKSAYRTLFSSERRIVVMFKEVRKDVAKFLEVSDFPHAEAAYAAAKSSLDTFVGAARTSGLSSDASELRTDLMAELADHLKVAADLYGEFVRDHKEKFFGALGPNIRKELVEPEAWREYANYVTGYALDAKVRAWQDDANNYFGVDLSPLSSGAREELKKELRDLIEKLIAELKEAGTSYQEVKVVIEDERDDVEDDLD